MQEVGEARTTCCRCLLPNLVRAVLAWPINTAPEEIAFVQNTSEGLSIIANALPLEAGDNVILFTATTKRKSPA